MNRRGFLSLLGLGAAGLVLDPERLLWVPGQKTIFLPSVVTRAPLPNIGQIVAEAWESVIAEHRPDVYSSRWLFEQLSKPVNTVESQVLEVAYA